MSRVRLDADTPALAQREQLNTQGARLSLEDWIVSHAVPRPGMRVLDLGCGRGKQLFALQRLVLPGGSLLGVDLSRQAVDAVNDRAAQQGLDHVRAIQCGLDECVTRLDARRFDLIISSYAIYYATDRVRLIGDLSTLLTGGGQIFVCGPGSGTNREMAALISAVTPAGEPLPEPVEDFLTRRDMAVIADRYRDLKVVRLDNSVEFASADDVMRWWSNHNSFIPERREAVAQALDEHFAGHGTFTMTKNVLGIHGHV